MEGKKRLLCGILAAWMLLQPAAALEENIQTESGILQETEEVQSDPNEIAEETAEPAEKGEIDNLTSSEDPPPETGLEEEVQPEPTQTEKNAVYLYSLGVLKGTGTDENGEPVFGLDKSITRIEVMAMMIRLLGQETAAAAHASDCLVFQDGGTWEKPYIGYAYAQGLTQGVSQTKFGTRQAADARQCLTFLLRTIGYSDAQGDFSFANVLPFAKELGIITQEQMDRWAAEGFTRGDLADVCTNILKTPVKNTAYTLEQWKFGTESIAADESLYALRYTVSGSTSAAYGAPVRMVVTVQGLTQPRNVNYAWYADGEKISSGTVELYNGIQLVYEKTCSFLAYDADRIQTISLVLSEGQESKTLRRQCNCRNQSVDAYIKGLVLPTNVSLSGGKRIVYGKSGAGRELTAYEFGTGSKVLFLNFAIHGFEDHWARDGYELVLTAQRMMRSLSDQIAWLNQHNWKVVVVPCANPDGLIDGWTNNGPGRCTTYRYENGKLVSGGIDLNRSFSRNFTVNTTARNYTTAVSMAAPEAQALGTLIRDKKSDSVNLFLDVHGWTQQTITSSGKNGVLNQVLSQYFPQNRWSSVVGARGYVANYAFGQGYQSALFEFPSDVRSHTAMVSRGYDTKFIEAMWTLMKKY